ncbi:MAG: MFS transporter [Caulobacteraceae bacterium]|nr:MFS transporter [Caulobacteraceae bacterium]
MSQSSPAAEPASGHAKYALGVLFCVYVVNLIDRQILSILMEPIKRDLNLSDTQLGLLSGLSFALFYAIAGIPIARAADRLSRRNIIAGALVLWSALTAICGVAQNFWQLMLTRIGVAVGEAGGGPPAHSMLADFFPHGQRSTALAIYSCGVPVGVLIGLAAGGWLNQAFNWRTAFVVVGLPGLILASVLFFTVKEPAREVTSAAPATDQPRPSTLEVLKTIWAIRSFRNLSGATALHVFSAYALLQWNPTFMVRTYELGTAQVGLYLGLLVGVCSGIGTFLGGWLGDHFAKRGQRWYARLPGIEIGITVPFYFGAYFAPTFEIALAFLIVPTLLSNAFTGPVFGAIQSLAPPHMRAMAAALLLFVIAVVGQGLGPQAVGILSDVFRSQAGNDSLRWAMAVIVFSKVLASWRFWVAGKQLEEDLAAAKAA